MWFVGVREQFSSALVPARLLVIGGAIAFVVAGCSGGGDSDTESSQPSNPPVAEESSPQPGAGDLIIASEPLGFESAVYEIPEPPVEDPDVPLPPFADSLDLIDAGVESGVWTGAEGVRAIMSILLGELPPDAVPEFDQLPAKGHAAVLTRAQEILADPAVDEAVRADLARLTNFFLSDSPYGPPGADGEASAPGEPAIVLASTRGVPRQSVNCGVSEVVLYGAQSSGLCYKEVTRGEDTILVPIEEGFDDVSDMVFGTIDRARDGYLDFTGFELQPVTVLLSPRESPADAEYAQGDVLGAVRSAGSSNCRLAIFVDSDVSPGDPEFRNTVAHELFHCVQGIWGGGSTDDFIVEAGASYFSYKLLNECVGGLTDWGPTLDQKTTNGSLLDLAYSGWFFWAFLDEQGYMTVQEIATLHRATYAGTDVEEALRGAVPDLPQKVNEFYARLMGPRLACDVQGSQVTATMTVDQEGPIELNASLWVGTRYKLEYVEKRLFEQKSDGPGLIGMAEYSKRSDEASWVTVEPEIRTECAMGETWMVVIGAQSDSSSSTPTTLEVTKLSEGVCDACLIGEWAINVDTMEPFFESFSPGATVDMSGDWTFEFGRSDGAPTAPFSDERDINVLLGGAFTVELKGEGTGPYSADGTFLSVLSYTDIVEVAAGGISGLFSNSDDGGGVAYLCEDDTFTFTFGGTTDVTAERIPSTPEGDPYFV